MDYYLKFTIIKNNHSTISYIDLQCKDKPSSKAIAGCTNFLTEGMSELEYDRLEFEVVHFKLLPKYMQQERINYYRARIKSLKGAARGNYAEAAAIDAKLSIHERIAKENVGV